MATKEITKTNGSQGIVQEIYGYREMIASLVRRDLRGRYKGNALGFLWNFINPLMQLLVYTLVFSVIMRNGIEDYYLYLFVALIPWIFFSSCISGGCNCILGNGDMVKKIYFPREVLPISYVTSQFVNMLLSFVVVFVVLIFSGKGLAPIPLLYLPIIMIVEYVLALGMTLLFSALTVYLRDIANILGIITMAWQFVTPVMYGREQVPARLLWVFDLNPMTSIIEAYRNILYYQQTPDMGTLLVAVIAGVAFLVVGELVFRHLQRGFAENL